MAISALLVAPAHANSIVGATGSTSCTELNIHDPDDSVIGYQRSNLTTPNHNQVDWILLNRVAPTDPEVGASSARDFIYYDYDYVNFCNFDWWSPSNPGGLQAFTKCSQLTGSACDTHKIDLHEGFTSTLDTEGRRRLICHETGHAIGITHNNHSSSALTSCMKNPASSGNKNYSDHEIDDMINYVW